MRHAPAIERERMIRAPGRHGARFRKLDPRAKIICFGALIWSVYSSTGPLAATTSLGLVIAVALSSGVRARGWLLPVWRFKWMCAAVFAINFFFDAAGGAYRAGLLVLQLAEMVILSVILGSTTAAGDLAWGTMWFLGPLKRVGVPVDEWAAALMMALRFIPLLNVELWTAVEGRKARGAAFDRGPLLARAENAAAAVLPAFYAAARRSELLAEGLAARGFSPGIFMGRATPKFRRIDYLAVGALGAAVVAIRLL
jgi:energy-coupling factor transport system permease protein